MSTQTPNTTPAAEIDHRIQKLKRHLDKNNLQGAFILQRSDLFYFTGTVQDAYLYVPTDGDPILFVIKDLERSMRESPIERIVSLQHVNELPKQLHGVGHSLTGNIGMELDVVPVNIYYKYKSLFPDAEFTDISVAIRTVRAIKSVYEIELMQKAADFLDQLLMAMKTLLREDIPEIELAGMMEAKARKLGHQGIVRMRAWGNEMFYGHLATGPSAAVPSFLLSPTGCQGLNPSVAQGASFKPIRKNEPVLFDYVFASDGYLMDKTRIFAMGQLPDWLLAGHEAMLEIERKIVSVARPGVPVGNLYEQAITLASELGYADNFLGTGDRRIRFVGHGVGIELDEYPFIAKGQRMKLEEGMVFALEPKLIFPGVGVVGIENTFLVTDTGLKQFGGIEKNIIFV